MSRVLPSRRSLLRRVPMVRRIVARVGLAVVNLLALPLRWLSGWCRRDPRVVVMGGNAGRFGDNARYLFLELARAEDLRCVWIAHDRTVRNQVRALGAQSELRWSMAGLRVCLRAGWYVFDGYLSDINFWTSRGARTLNLWHGIPMKAIEFDITSGPLARVYGARSWSPVRLAFIDRFVPPDYLLSTSRFISESCFAPAFRIPVERCLEFGYPRTDHLFDVASTAPARLALGVPDEIDEVFGYFPTWRDDGADFLGDAGFSFDALNEALAAANRFLLFKAHPNFAKIAPRRSNWSNLRVLDSSADIYGVLPACDVLITDYSSIAYDFLVLERPVIYFVPDHDRYVSQRNVYFSFDEMAVGPVVTTCADLYEMVRTSTDFGMQWARHDRVRKLVWDDYSGDSIHRITSFIRGTTSGTASGGGSKAAARAGSAG